MSSTSLEIVILAAGKGTRMKSALPKVLHKIAGKALIQHVVDTALTLSPTKIHIVAGHGKQQVMNSLESHANNINWVIQEQQLGTGHAVKQALPHIDSASNVLVLYGDVPLISAETLNKLVSSMSSTPLALLTAFLDNPTGYGRILHNNTGDVSGIVEQKDANSEQRAINEINSGFLCAQAGHLADWLNNINDDNSQNELYLTDIVGLAHKTGNPITSIQPASNDEIFGINSRSELANVERLFQRSQAEALMAQGVTIIDPDRIDIRGEVTIGADSIIDVNTVIEGPTVIGCNVNIGPNCVIQQATIADNATINSHTVIEQSSLGEAVVIGPFARLRPGTKLAAKAKIGNFVELKNASLGEGSKVNHLSYVGDAVVGTNTNIGAGVITCNYDGANKFQTSIGDNVFVGSDCQLIAPVSIDNEATIGAGTTLTNNVKAGQLAISRSKQRLIDGWQRPTKKPK